MAALVGGRFIESVLGGRAAVTKTRPLFLLCNDDGVHAPGIAALAEAIAPIGEVVIVAPHVEKSASSQALSISLPLRMERLRAGVYAVEGTPADCVQLALKKILDRKPDYVLSGINRGANLGLDVLYSGTVGAALEARIHGFPSLAFSCHGYGALDYAAAAHVARFVVERREEIDLGDQHILNVNIPSGPVAALKGISFASLGRRKYEEFIYEAVDPRGRQYFWIGAGGESHEDIPGSDCDLANKGFATISALRLESFDASLNDRLRDRLGERWSGALAST